MSNTDRPTTGGTNSDFCEFDLSCPVCLELYADPLFVCSNHHSLCRACYTRLSSSAGSSRANCPLCQDKMTRPVENELLRNKVEERKSLLITRSSTLHRGTCQADDGGNPCPRAACDLSNMCDKNFCALHFSSYRLKLEAEWKEILASAEELAVQMKRKEELRKEWDELLSDRIQLLEGLRSRFKEELSPAIPEAKLSEQIRKLQSAMEFEDLRTARVTAEALKATTAASHKEDDAAMIAAAPSAEEKNRLAENALDDVENLCTRALARSCSIRIISAKLQRKYISNEAKLIEANFEFPNALGCWYICTEKVALSDTDRCKLIGDEIEITFDFYCSSARHSFENVSKHDFQLVLFLCSYNDSASMNRLCDASIQIAGYIAAGRDISQEDFPLVSRNSQIIGSIRISSNIPSVARGAFDRAR